MIIPVIFSTKSTVYHSVITTKNRIVSLVISIGENIVLVCTAVKESDFI